MLTDDQKLLIATARAALLDSPPTSSMVQAACYLEHTGWLLEEIGRLEAIAEQAAHNRVQLDWEHQAKLAAEKERDSLRGEVLSGTNRRKELLAQLRTLQVERDEARQQKGILEGKLRLERAHSERLAEDHKASRRRSDAYIMAARKELGALNVPDGSDLANCVRALREHGERAVAVGAENARLLAASMKDRSRLLKENAALRERFGVAECFTLPNVLPPPGRLPRLWTDPSSGAWFIAFPDGGRRELLTPREACEVLGFWLEHQASPLRVFKYEQGNAAQQAEAERQAAAHEGTAVMLPVPPAQPPPQAVQTASGMGVDFIKNEVRELTGLSDPGTAISARELAGTTLELLMALAEKLTGDVPVVRLRYGDGKTREEHLASGAGVRWCYRDLDDGLALKPVPEVTVLHRPPHACGGRTLKAFVDAVGVQLSQEQDGRWRVDLLGRGNSLDNPCHCPTLQRALETLPGLLGCEVAAAPPPLTDALLDEIGRTFWFTSAGKAKWYMHHRLSGNRCQECPTLSAVLHHAAALLARDKENPHA